MSFLFLFFFLLAAALPAQQAANLGEGWHFSFSVFPEVDKYQSFSTYVTAADTVARQPISTGNRNLFPRRTSDTLQLDGSEVVYFSERTLSDRGKVANPKFNVGLQLKAHYRFQKGIELSGGLFFRQYTTDHRRPETAGLPAESFYHVSKLRHTIAGTTAAGSYHFRKEKRFQPYVGLRLFTLINWLQSTDHQLVSPDRDETFSRPITPRFARNTILDFDMEFFGGLSYQFTDRFSAATEAKLRVNDNYLPELTNLVLRYHPARKQTPLR